MRSVTFQNAKLFLNGLTGFLSTYVCEVILVICLFFSFQFQREFHNYEKIIKSDGHGYYAYLPAIFIYQDYDFSFLNDISAKYVHMTMSPDIVNKTPTGNTNKYFIGASLFWLPFFLVAHLLATIFDLSADGYSVIYQLSVLIAANFYLWVGCRFLLKLISRFPLSKTMASYIVLLIVFGTNLFCYTSFDASFTHVYSFAAITAFLYLISRFFDLNRATDLYWSAFLLGIITLLRPTNIVIALLFLFFAGSFHNLVQVIIKYKKVLLLSALIFLLTLFPQFLLYYLQTGQFFVWSYGTESFNFLDPYISDTLFSYKKGLFIYVPLILVSLLGLSSLHLNNRFQFRSMFLFLFINTYIISSWWSWWYGNSLGQRSFIDFYGVLGILLALAYSSRKAPYEKWIYIALGPVFIYYSVVLTYQYRHYIIDHGGMNKQTYWFTFMKTDKSIAGIATNHKLFTDIEIAHIVNIKASNNKFLSAEMSELKHILADKDHTLGWEFYNMVKLPGNKVAFKCHDGNYISTQPDSGSVITHSASKPEHWEEYEMIFTGQKSFVLKACNDRFVQRDNEMFRATANSFTDAEQFLLINK